LSGRASLPGTAKVIHYRLACLANAFKSFVEIRPALRDLLGGRILGEWALIFIVRIEARHLIESDAVYPELSKYNAFLARIV